MLRFEFALFAGRSFFVVVISFLAELHSHSIPPFLSQFIRRVPSPEVWPKAPLNRHTLDNLDTDDNPCETEDHTKHFEIRCFTSKCLGLRKKYSQVLSFVEKIANSPVKTIFRNVAITMPYETVKELLSKRANRASYIPVFHARGRKPMYHFHLQPQVTWGTACKCTYWSLGFNSPDLQSNVPRNSNSIP